MCASNALQFLILQFIFYPSIISHTVRETDFSISCTLLGLGVSLATGSVGSDLDIVPDMDEDDFVPGTVHLIDLEGILSVKHASGHQEDVVLVPEPSEDPDDPLNWSAKRKLLSTTCICVYVIQPYIEVFFPR